MATRILAKRLHGGKQVDLFEHSRTVLTASRLLFGSLLAPTRLGSAWVRFFKITDSLWDRFIRTLDLACMLHDLGKANSEFQGIIRGKGSQTFRHEHLSGLILRCEPLATWLAGTSAVDHDILLAAIISHHLKVKHDNFGKRLTEGKSAVSFCMDADEVKKCLEQASQVAEIRPPALDGHPWLWDSATVSRKRKEFQRMAEAFHSILEEDEQRGRLLVAVKAALIAADALGSASVRENITLEQWIQGCFDGGPLTAHWIDTSVIRPRMDEVERRQRRSFFWHDFQLSAAMLGPRALLLSGCGTGKTLAAWKWIQSQLVNYSASRAIFLYPTRATATEGFRDYVSWAGDTFAALQHGTSEYDLTGMFDNPGDPRRDGDYHVQERLFALAYWPKKVFSATVDSFLAFMRNQYASMCMLPVLCDSVVVIDEVHSFDRGMFTALERFLKFFDIPVLCMTATLPEDRRRILHEDCGLQVFPSESGQFDDLDRQAAFPRYHFSKFEGQDVETKVRACLSEGKKILWVVNTVARCQEIANAFRNPQAIKDVLCYHSRFRLMDRKVRHEDVIRVFRERSGPLLLIATQVCEMSLDIDADVLVSETAPVPSLIQRMGRCCREPIPTGGRFGEVICYSPTGHRPYETDEIKKGEDFVNEMVGLDRNLSQADLAGYLEHMDVLSPFARGGYTGFLDSGMYAMSRDESFREGESYTVDSVLVCDVHEYLRLKSKGDPAAQGMIVPVPRRFAIQSELLGPYLREASESHYDHLLGFCEWEVKDE